MKILFVFFNDLERTFVPIDIVCLENYLRYYGKHETKVFDTSFYKEVVDLSLKEKQSSRKIYKEWNPDAKLKDNFFGDFVDCIGDWKPQLIAFTCYSEHWEKIKKVVSYIKERLPEILIIIGGPHATICPEEVIGDNNVDMLCRGEGEEALLELCNALDHKKDVTRIKNLWVKHEGNIIKNELRSFLDLDKLPEPDWSRFSPIHYKSPFEGKLAKMAMVEFSRGCPFQCTYCGNKMIKQVYEDSGHTNYIRRKSPKKFIKDLSVLIDKYGIELFYITDGTFLTMPTEVLEELSNLYKENIAKPFFILTTANSINEKRAQLLKEMGCIMVNIGIESGDYEYRKNVLARLMSDEQIINAFAIMKHLGIKTTAYNIIGMPFQGRAAIFKTIELNRLSNPDATSACIFLPYPGTELRRIAIEHHMLNKDCGFVGDMLTPVIRLSGISSQELVGLHKTFYLYCKVPKILFPIVRLCEFDNPISNLIFKLLAFIF